MQKSAKYALIACLVVVLGGGFAFYWFALRDTAPPEASLRTREVMQGVRKLVDTETPPR